MDLTLTAEPFVVGASRASFPPAAIFVQKDASCLQDGEVLGPTVGFSAMSLSKMNRLRDRNVARGDLFFEQSILQLKSKHKI